MLGLFILANLPTLWAVAKLYREGVWAVRYMRMTRRYKGDINKRFWILADRLGSRR